ncbi:MAG: substrate-binding domain-containing protein, partial [Oscillospiraceae bacterium]|nr:substrate-binding domain-containing protein [Oscillospiraceae bacterium]
FVNSENPVDGLTSDQIRKIYSGEYTSWRKAGGANIPILAFQRPKGSGSQTRMEYFMGDVPLKEPLEIEYEYSMVGVIKEVASYQNKGPR